MIDTGFLRDWTLIQIEGEEPLEQVQDSDPKAGGKKAPPAKGGAPPAKTGALEAITDNRPREIQYVKNVAEDEGAPTKITEDVAKYFEKFLLRVEVYFVDRETQEEKFKEAYDLDVSPLLFETQNNSEGLVWKFDKLKTLELLYMNVTVSSDVPMLNSFYRKKLNPM
jgi:hypothetical protein